MANSTAANDTRQACNAAASAAHSLKTLLDGYVTVIGGEGGTEAAATFAAMSAAIAPSLETLDAICAALNDTFAQNS